MHILLFCALISAFIGYIAIKLKERESSSYQEKRILIKQTSTNDTLTPINNTYREINS